MSITVSTDVWCDGCGVWIAGPVGRRVDSRGAHRTAAAAGWTRRRLADRVLDLCPRCSTDRIPRWAVISAARVRNIVAYGQRGDENRRIDPDRALLGTESDETAR